MERDIRLIGNLVADMTARCCARHRIICTPLSAVRRLTHVRICRIEGVALVHVNAKVSMFIRYWQSRRAYQAKRLTQHQDG
jgi:hypothetical protein